jgi:DNA-binding IclR family transcriptional regulator
MGSGTVELIAFGKIVLEVLGRKPQTLQQLAEALDKDLKEVELLLSELTGTGWVVQTGEQYMLVEQPVA